ncbi:MAG: hypothetical protein ACXADL_02925 [Candidatus Thorarchaeota archaeon]|jgi:riboflavin transporter FmnP
MSKSANSWFERHPLRKDSKSIALLSIFTAMVVALEVLPIVGITDIPIPGINFTVDWTGIPIIIIFLGLGTVFSLVSILVMFVAIGYRNPIGATFKGFAELYKILGMAVAWAIFHKRGYGKTKMLIIYVIFATVFCSVGMFVTNIILFPVLLPFIPDPVLASTIYVPWNALQAIINVAAGGILYYMIPEKIRLQAGFGREGQDEILVLKPEELEEPGSTQ